MEKILAIVMTNKKVTTMANRSLLEAVFDYAQTDNHDDLSSWEIINPSDDDEIETYSFSSSSGEDNEEDIHALDSTSSEQEDLIDRHFESVDVKVVSIVEPSGHDDDYDGGNYDRDVMDDEEDDYDDDDDDYDDELVPRSLRDRFGKQRLTKLGNRACNPKMSNPKKLPCYFYNRPGGASAATRNGGVWKRKNGRN